MSILFNVLGMSKKNTKRLSRASKLRGITTSGKVHSVKPPGCLRWSESENTKHHRTSSNIARIPSKMTIMSLCQWFRSFPCLLDLIPSLLVTKRQSGIQIHDVLHMFADVTSRSVVLLQVVSVHHQLSSPATQCRTLKDTQACRQCLCTFFSWAQSLHIDGCAWIWNPLTCSLRHLSASFGIRGFQLDFTCLCPQEKPTQGIFWDRETTEEWKLEGMEGARKRTGKAPTAWLQALFQVYPSFPWYIMQKWKCQPPKTSKEKTQGDPSFRDLDNEWVQTDFCVIWFCRFNFDSFYNSNTNTIQNIHVHHKLSRSSLEKVRLARLPSLCLRIWVAMRPTSQNRLLHESHTPRATRRKEVIRKIRMLGCARRSKQDDFLVRIWPLAIASCCLGFPALRFRWVIKLGSLTSQNIR